MINRHYWQTRGVEATFTHELLHDWLKPLARSVRVLDFGCGYGRITRELYDLGFTAAMGYDPSRPMIARAEKEHPGPVYTSRREDISRRRFDLIVCLALFTSCPEKEEQARLRETIEALAAPSCLLYISDLLISENPHYRKRYEERRLGLHGCFESTGGALFRHHEPEHFSRLFSGWRKIRQASIKGRTLNDNAIIISQFLYAKG